MIRYAWEKKDLCTEWKCGAKMVLFYRVEKIESAAFSGNEDVPSPG